MIKADSEPRQEHHRSICLQAQWFSLSFCKKTGVEPLPQAPNSSTSVEKWVGGVAKTDPVFSSPPLEVNALQKQDTWMCPVAPGCELVFNIMVANFSYVGL